jgi:hypothetical protein
VDHGQARDPTAATDLAGARAKLDAASRVLERVQGLDDEESLEQIVTWLDELAVAASMAKQFVAEAGGGGGSVP